MSARPTSRPTAAHLVLTLSAVLTAALIPARTAGAAAPAESKPAAVAAPAAPAAVPAPDWKPLATVEGITEYRLPNGLRVLFFPDASTPRVTVNMTVFVGSRHEGYGEAGMAHLLEHMLFKGCPAFPDVPKALRDHGADFNGTTSYDRTNYFETMLGTEENLEFALRLEADRMLNSFIRKEDLASEFSVVRSEFESGENNPESVLFQRMMAAAFEWHGYGRTVIGNRSDIERVPVDNLRAFYRKHYQPDNALLVIAGKFDPEVAKRLVTKHLAALPRPERKLDTTWTEEPAQDGERTVVLRRVGKVASVGALYHAPSAIHEDFPALTVLADVLDTEPTGRLYKALVETKKAGTVGAFAFGLAEPGVFIASASVEQKEGAAEAAAAEAAESLRDELLRLVETAADTPFTAEEVDRTKRKLAKEYELLLTNSNRVGISLSEWAAKGDWRLFFLNRDRVAKVTPDDLAKVARKYLLRNNRTVGMFIPAAVPQRAVIPATPDPAELVKGYTGGTAVAAGEAFEPTPDNIEARVVRGALPSGIKTALLPRKTRGELAYVRLNLRYGNESSLKGLVSAAEFLPDLMERGTANRTRKELQDELDKLTARVGIGGQPGLLTVSIQVKKANLAATLDLVGEMLRSPSFPADEFDVMKRQTLEGLRKALPEPQALASNALRRHLAPYPADDVRYMPTLPESIARVEAVTVAQIKEIWEKQIGASHGEVVFVGDFDKAHVDRLAGLIAGWKSDVPWRRLPRDADVKVPGGRLTIETPDKANALFIAAHTVGIRDDDPDYLPAKIADFVFGEAALASRVSNRIRGKDGLSYGAGAQFNASPVDKAGTFVAFAICNPKNIEKVDAAFADELAKMLKDGLTEKELTEGRAAYLKDLQNDRASDAALAGMLADRLFVGRTFADDKAREERIGKLTLEEVNAAFRRQVDAGRLFIIHAGDFRKGSTETKDNKSEK